MSYSRNAQIHADAMADHAEAVHNRSIQRRITEEMQRQVEAIRAQIAEKEQRRLAANRAHLPGSDF